MKTKPFKEAYIKKMLGYVTAEQMSFSRMVELLNEEAKSYALEACKESLKNSNFRFEKHYYLDNVDMPFEKHKIRELITDEENIPKEVKS